MRDRDGESPAAAGPHPPGALTPGRRHAWVLAARHLRLGDAGRPAALAALVDAGYPPTEAGEIVEAIMAAWPPT